MLRVQSTMCATCIYRPNSPLNLAKLERDAARKDSHRICHHSKEAVCAGFWAKHKNNFNLGRIAQRLGCVEMVDDDTMPELRRRLRPSASAEEGGGR